MIVRYAAFLLLFLLILVLGTTLPAHAQSGQPNLNPPYGAADEDRDPESARARKDLEKEQQKERNLARQKQIKAETDQLLKLATELKNYVDKSNENTLSLDVVRKAEEIEKLAHDVKDKMKSGT